MIQQWTEKIKLSPVLSSGWGLPGNLCLLISPWHFTCKVRFSVKCSLCSYMLLAATGELLSAAASGEKTLLVLFIPILGKFLYFFLGRKLYLAKSWLGTFSAIIHSGPSITLVLWWGMTQEHIRLCWTRSQMMCKRSQEQGSVFFLRLMEDNQH